MKEEANNNIITIQGQFVDIYNREVFPASVVVENGMISSIHKTEKAPPHYILPGFVDAHVHIESSLLVPSEFARLAVLHGTVATVSDPHEIANVCGLEGVYYMIQNGNQVNFKFYFGAPSCVPATHYETAGAVLGITELEKLLSDPQIRYLAEMMNWPGVINRDETVMQKLKLAQKYNKPIDGHAPGLTGDLAQKYVTAGISTDHESFTYEEAKQKLDLGMKIAIREGSAAKNFEALIDLIDNHADDLMFCSDDKHPDSLLIGHINTLVSRAIKKGKDLFDVLKVACINPVTHYGLDVGTLQVGDAADFILVEDLENFEVLKTYINGHLVADKGVSLIKPIKSSIINKFIAEELTEGEFEVEATGKFIRVIVAEDGQLVTREERMGAPVKEGKLHADVRRDILKIAVINRYRKEAPSIGFVKNFGLRKGAIASSVAHDSHNVIVVGVDDHSMANAANAIIREKGGLSVCDGESVKILPLPVGGIMAVGDGFYIADTYKGLDIMTKEVLGSNLTSPFMTLSFMALLVIPSLKLSDRGLFDGSLFTFVPLTLEEGVL